MLSNNRSTIAHNGAIFKWGDRKKTAFAQFVEKNTIKWDNSKNPMGDLYFTLQTTAKTNRSSAVAYFMTLCSHVIFYKMVLLTLTQDTGKTNHYDIAFEGYEFHDRPNFSFNLF